MNGAWQVPLPDRRDEDRDEWRRVLGTRRGRFKAPNADPQNRIGNGSRQTATGRRQPADGNRQPGDYCIR
jgi:hypothetical protein